LLLTASKLFTKKSFGRIICWPSFTSTSGTKSQWRFAIRLTGFRTGAEKIADDDFIEKLLRLCLHGHVHEDRADLVGYLHPTRKLHMAGAGSFGAVAADRPPSTPRLYNLIEIPRDHSLIRVHIRCMRRESGAWDGWAVWPGDNASVKKAFYEIKLK
jgi:hypothetical protein